MVSLLLLAFFPTHYTLANESCFHDSKNFRCVQYIKNYDADTITFNIPNIHPLIGSKISVRVSGVDTPEMKTKDSCEKEKALHAKKEVARLLKNAQRIDLKNIKRGKYFRIVADVKVNGKSLTEYLLENGFAYAYSGGTKRKIDWCKGYREIASDKN